MSTRADDITKLLLGMVDPIQKLNMLLQQDRVSYELVRGDMESLKAKKEKALEELAFIEKENEKARALAASIVEVAKEQAAKVLEASNDKRLEALKMVEDAKEYAKKIDKAHHEKIMEKLDTKFDKVLGRK
jgi:hypothetical protein